MTLLANNVFLIYFLFFFLEIIERNQSNLLNEVVENRKERALLMVSVQWNT